MKFSCCNPRGRQVIAECLRVLHFLKQHTSHTATVSLISFLASRTSFPPVTSPSIFSRLSYHVHYRRNLRSSSPYLYHVALPIIFFLTPSQLASASRPSTSPSELTSSLSRAQIPVLPSFASIPITAHVQIASMASVSSPTTPHLPPVLPAGSLAKVLPGGGGKSDLALNLLSGSSAGAFQVLIGQPL